MSERTIFLEALEKDNPEQRSAFLDEVCGEDAELRQRVETLLSAHNDAGSFLEKTPQEIDADSVFGETVGGTPDRADGSAADNSASDEAWQNLLTPTDATDRLGNLGPYERRRGSAKSASRTFAAADRDSSASVGGTSGQFGPR